ncbi:HIT family protein [Mucilaginibacter auburnensis]|uniref:Histidine triad (HIT) family protein n=1 Tax=Mucilaginibacter auburnensis TaxID=1457233 RepID=A0A2H9VS77_9SPHI|nr:HIT family protein [Mucilaginibacter auburnensis]PJJ83677.1 histidine triad (HIT) family protein [Mucilaginibacter auburnensis]
MASIFSKIVAGDIPAYKVAESNEFLAFLDINPLVEGHLLVIPKKEVDRLFDLDDETYTGLMIFAKIIATAMKKVIACDRIGVTVMGLEVPHAHVHLIPMKGMHDMDFTRPKLNFTPEEFQAIADRIREAL